MKTGLLRRAAVLTIGIGTSLSVAAQQPPSSAVRLSSPETIHVRLTLDDAIYAAQNQSIAAMVAKYTFLSAYWSFRSFQASRLPSLNLTGEVLSFDRSLRLLQDYDTGEMRYLDNYNLQKYAGLVDQAGHCADGRNPAALFVAQPTGPVRPEGFEILLFAARYALVHPTAVRLQQTALEQENRPEGVRTRQAHLHRVDGGGHDAGRQLLLQTAVEQDQTLHRRQELRQHHGAARHCGAAAPAGQHHAGRTAATPAAHAQRQPVDQRHGPRRPRAADETQFLPPLQRKRRHRPRARRPDSGHRRRLCPRPGQGAGKFVVQRRQPDPHAQRRCRHRPGQSRAGRVGYDKRPFRIVADRGRRSGRPIRTCWTRRS